VLPEVRSRRTTASPPVVLAMGPSVPLTGEYCWAPNSVLPEVRGRRTTALPPVALASGIFIQPLDRSFQQPPLTALSFSLTKLHYA
jgi:hypothetical protein